MKDAGKTFLPHPIYRPLAVAFFAFLGAIAAFGVFQTGLLLGDDFLWVTVLGAILCLIAFVVAIAYFIKFFWTVFIRGGWRKEYGDRRKMNTWP